MSIQKKVILLGYYGANFGDLVMLKSLVSGLENRNCKMVIYSYSNVTDELRKELLETQIYSLIDEGRLKGLLRFVKDVLQSKAIIWGGGTCFMDQGGEGGIKYMLLAKLLFCKVFYFGIGIGKLETIKYKFYLRLAVYIASFFYVRDSRSYSIIRSLTKRVAQCPDPAYAYRYQEYMIESVSVEGVLVSYRNLHEYYTEEEAKNHLDRFIDALMYLINFRGIKRVYIIDADNEVDGVDGCYIFERLKGVCSVEYNTSTRVDSKLALLAKSEIVITGRLHVGVMAHEMGKQFILLNYSPKNEEFARSVNCMSAICNYVELQQADVFVDKLHIQSTEQEGKKMYSENSRKVGDWLDNLVNKIV